MGLHHLNGRDVAAADQFGKAGGVGKKISLLMINPLSNDW